MIISILNSTNLNTEKTCGSARKFFYLDCTFFTVITTILEVRAPIASPVKSFKVRVCYVKVFKNNVVEHIGVHHLVSDYRNRFLQSNSVCRKRSKNALWLLINVKPSSAFFIYRRTLEVLLFRSLTFPFSMEYTRISSGSPFGYMVPIMPFASFFSIPHHIPFFHATALETNQKVPILIACYFSFF